MTKPGRCVVRYVGEEFWSETSVWISGPIVLPTLGIKVRRRARLGMKGWPITNW